MGEIFCVQRVNQQELHSSSLEALQQQDNVCGRQLQDLETAKRDFIAGPKPRQQVGQRLLALARRRVLLQQQVEAHGLQSVPLNGSWRQADNTSCKRVAHPPARPPVGRKHKLAQTSLLASSSRPCSAWVTSA